jgi:hypothetical protein
MNMAALAGAAAIERDLRAEHYPAQIARGEIQPGEADDDLRAWIRIAAFVADGQFRIGDLERGPIWTPLAEAADRALARRDAACQAAPRNRALARRRENVAAIAALLGRIASAFEGRAAA